MPDAESEDRATLESDPSADSVTVANADRARCFVIPLALAAKRTK